MRCLWSLAVAFLALLVLSGVAVVEAGEGRHEGFHVRWDEGLEKQGRMALVNLRRIRQDVDRLLGWESASIPAEVVIVSGLDRMREATGAQVPDWAVGAAISSRNLIVIRTDLLARGFGGTLAQVLRHEWVHLSWGHQAGVHRRQLPLWVEEGIAEEIGGGISVDAGAALDFAVAFRRLHDFEDLRQHFPADARDADLAYKQSRSWVRYLVAEAGWPAVQAVLESVRTASLDTPDGGDEVGRVFEDALLAHTNRPLGEWHTAWRVQLEEDAVPWYLHLLIQNFQGLIIAALAVIGLGTFAFLLRRRRRQIARLPDGPEIHDPGGGAEVR